MIKVPTTGEKITYKDNQLVVPNNPIIPFIEGDGIGVDITPVMKDVVNAAVAKAYGGEKEISWMEIFCGEKSVEVYGDDQWLPEETLQAYQGLYSFNQRAINNSCWGWDKIPRVAAIRQKLDLSMYA